MKKNKLIIFISIFILTLLLGGGIVFAYFGYFYKLQGSEIVMENVKFSVNEYSNKNEAHSIDIPSEELEKTDGYQIVLDYSLNGTFVSNYAMRYSTYFQIEEDKNGIANALDLYRFVDDRYVYLDKLSNIAQPITDENEPTALFTDYLGPMGTHKEKLLLVYPMGSSISTSSTIKIRISTTSNLTTTTSNDFPYYYVNDVGTSDDQDSVGKSAENLFLSLPNNEDAYGRTIVLMKDIIYSSTTNIIFNNLVGLDLNGHILNLNGGTITFNDSSEVGTNNYPNCVFTDSSDGEGRFRGSINFNYEKSVVKIHDSFISALEHRNDLIVEKISGAAFIVALEENISKITKEKHITQNNSFTFDVFGSLKNYFDYGVTKNIEKIASVHDEVSVSLSDSKIVVSNVTSSDSNVTSSDIVTISITITDNNSNDFTTLFNIELYGSSMYDCVEYLKSYIPARLNGSIYLPTYISSFNSYITWISSDEDILSDTGELLPHGYSDLDNWYGKYFDLGFIIDQNGEVSNGLIKDIYAVILTEEERSELLLNSVGITFDGNTTTKYSFNFIDMLYEKYGDYNKDGSVDLVDIKDAFNISSYDDEEDLLNQIIAKLGLKDIPYTVIANQESGYITETSDENINISKIEQNGKPSSVVFLVYNINYQFNNGTSDNLNVSKNKIFTISSDSEVVSFVDLTNTLRVPFDTYSTYMTDYEIVDGSYYYNKYVNSFELVSTFNDVVIDYIVPDEYKDYVGIKTYSNGAKTLQIKKDNVPADTHTVTVSARISGYDDPIYLSFTCVGVLHNVSSKKHAEFEDSNLYIELLNKYDTNSDTVLTDLEAKNSNITSFIMNGRGVESLVGLKYFTNLTTINFNNNKIVNISDLEKLSNLTEVNLNNNLLTSLETFRYSDSLSTLNVGNNAISSIEPLQYLTNLTSLDLSYNNIANFKYVENLTNLKTLKVNNNVISGNYTVYLEAHGSSSGTFNDLIRGNQYYFNILKKNDENINIYIADGGSTAYSFTNDYTLEAYILSLIEPITYTSDTITLPTYVYYNGVDYEITYFTTNYNNYIEITRNDSTDSSPYRVTNISLKQLPVDNDVIIYANTIALSSATFYRPFEFNIRKGSSGDTNYGQIEVTTGNWVDAATLVPDVTLLSHLWVIYDVNSDGKITNTELKHEGSEVTLDFDSIGIENLKGIQYFGNITSLNLRGNEFKDENNDGYADISYISYLTSLKTLYLSSQLYNFDELLYYTRLNNSGVYKTTNTTTFSLKNIGNDDFNVELTYGLTSLEKLYVNGSLSLNEYKEKTQLYHVYLNNGSLEGIYKDSDSTLWNPLTEEINKFLGSMTTSAKFINYNDEVQIKKEYNFYIYDDLYPTTFSLTSGTISSTEYVFAGGSTGNKPSDANYKNVYYADGSHTTLSGVDTSFIAKENHRLSSYFNIDTSDSTNISIKYTKLMYKDYQAYLNMTLTTTSLSQERRSVSISSNYYLTLFMQYNNDYTFLDDSSIDSSMDGKPINSVFGAVETMLLVMNGITKELRAGDRGYNYQITYNDGTYESFTEGSANYVVKSSETATYDGTYDSTNGGTAISLANGKSNNYYFIHGNFMPTATSAVDGLRYLPQITKVYFRRDAVLGTGKDLINIEELFAVYTYFDIKDFNTILPNMKILILGQSTGTNLSNETSLDSNPNNLIESFMVWFPNLIEFYNNGEGDNGKGTMYEWSAFLAYSYIPYNQIFKQDSSGNYVYYNVVNNVERVGGVSLDLDGYYYWYDEDNETYENFKPLYYYSGSLYQNLTQSYIDSNLSSIFNTDGDYFANIYVDTNGNKLKSSNQIFRHVRYGSISLNNFKLNGSAITYANTYEHREVLMELYRNLTTGSETHFYLTGGLAEGNSYSGFDPTFSNITYSTTIEQEYQELAPTIADLHVKLTGTTFDGTSLDDTLYSSLMWNETDYSDYFRQGLTVKLPTTFDDYKTGITAVDAYRNFTITWYLSYVIMSKNTATEVNALQKTQIILGDNTGFKISSSYGTYISNRSFSDNELVFTLNYSGYYVFEGLIELSDGTDSHVFSTTYDKRRSTTYLETNDEVGGSYSIIYPLTITSLTDTMISELNSNQIKSAVKFTDALTTISYGTSTLDASITNNYNLRWFDTIVDRTLKFVVFIHCAKNDKYYDSNYDTVTSTFEMGKSDEWVSYPTMDMLLIYSFGLSKYNTDNLLLYSYSYENNYSSINNKGYVRTFAGLKYLMSDIFTLDGWEFLNVSSFIYKYAQNVAYIPKRIPVKLTYLYLSSNVGITYYGGIFDSNLVDVLVRNEAVGEGGTQNMDVFAAESTIDLRDYLDGNSKIKLRSLDVNEITEESYPLLATILNNNGITSDKFTLTTRMVNNVGTLLFYDYANVSSFISGISTYMANHSGNSKLEVKLRGNIDLYTILSNLSAYYGQIDAPDLISSSNLYSFSGSFASGYDIVVPNSDVLSNSSNAQISSDFYPNFIVGTTSYNVLLRYTDGQTKVGIFKNISGNTTGDESNRYKVYVATFKNDSSISNDPTNYKIVSNAEFLNQSYRYTVSDLNIFDASEFDPNWLNFLLSLTYVASNCVSSIEINGYEQAVNAITMYQYHNGNYYTPGLSNPRSSEGYGIIFDTQLDKTNKNYYLIINTEYFQFEYAANGGYTAPRSYNYSTIDMKGWDLLPFKVISVGNGVNHSNFTVKKIINSGSVTQTPKITYFGIGINWVYWSQRDFAISTVIYDISGLKSLMADNSTLYLGGNVKIMDKDLKFDSTGFHINYSDKNINIDVNNRKLRSLFYNGSYDSSINYLVMKQEIIKTIYQDSPLLFEDFTDFYRGSNEIAVSYNAGRLSNITMFTNNMNHPVFSADGPLADDSVYNFNVKQTQVYYAGAKYDVNRLVATLINVHSDNIRTLSNNKVISILDDTTSSTTLKQLDADSIYTLTESSPIYLPHTNSAGKSIIYYPLTEINSTSGGYEAYHYYSGYALSTNPSADYAVINQMFQIEEYENYWKISLREGHPQLTEVRYLFGCYYDNNIYSVNTTYQSISIRGRVNFSKNISYFRVDVSYSDNIGHHVIKSDEPLKLAKEISILNYKYRMSYSVVNELEADYLNIVDNTYYYEIALSSNAITTSNVKIKATIERYTPSYTTEDQPVYTESTSYISSTTYYYIDNGTYNAISLQNSRFYDLYKEYYGTLYYISDYTSVTVTTYSSVTLSSFSFYVDLSTGERTVPSDEYDILSSDFYVEALVNSETNEYVSASLIFDGNGDYITSSDDNEVYVIDSNGTPKTGYEWKILKADTIFESGLLLTDLYYSGVISIGSNDYVTHHTASKDTFENVAYFPKYVVLDSNGEFVLNDDNLITYSNDDYSTAKSYISSNSSLNYHLGLIYIKEQIKDIHYFSNTNFVNNQVDFRAQSSLEGLDIFPLTHVRFGYYTTEYKFNGTNSRSFPGNTFEALKNMKLEEFTLVFKHTSIFVSDWSFLFNSKDSLKTFIYGGIYTGQTETYGTTHDDFNFLLRFENLENVRLYGLPGIDYTQSFKYFVTSMYLLHGSNIVHYYYNNNSINNVYENSGIFTDISSDVNTATTILSLFDSSDSIASTNQDIDADFIFQNGYELYYGSGGYYSNILNYDENDSTTEYLLPTFINDSGTYYKLTYDSLSNFVDIYAKDSEDNLYTMLQYQEKYKEFVLNCLENNLEVNDYDFAKNYKIYARFKNLGDCLTDRIMLSVKVESQSKMISKTDILDKDLSTDALKLAYENDNYFDGNTYIYTPYTYSRYVSIYVDHEAY